MAATNSTMQTLGRAASPFELPNVTNNNELVLLSDYSDQPLLIMFICNHCPFVIHLIEPLVTLANLAQEKGFGVVAISSNDAATYPQDSPEKMQAFAQQYGFEFPYCYDQSQSVAKAYGAACTPDFFIYDRAHELRYRGQMDASRPGNGVAPDGGELTAALDKVFANELVTEPQTPSIGCNIKWRPGNQPDYF